MLFSLPACLPVCLLIYLSSARKKKTFFARGNTFLLSTCIIFLFYEALCEAFLRILTALKTIKLNWIFLGEFSSRANKINNIVLVFSSLFAVVRVVKLENANMCLGRGDRKERRKNRGRNQFIFWEKSEIMLELFCTSSQLSTAPSSLTNME